MVKIYVDLILKGRKTINDVPIAIRAAVLEKLKEVEK